MTEETAETKLVTHGSILEGSLTRIQSVLPEGMSAKRLSRLAMQCLYANPELKKCTPHSFLVAVIACAACGLEPVLGQAALVPYKRRVTFQPMYQGLVNLVYNTGFVSVIDADVVRLDEIEQQCFEYELGTSKFLHHRPIAGNESELRYAYAIATMTGGAEKFVVLDRREVLRRRAVAQTGKIWNQWEAEQWKKTAVKMLTKLLPKSIRLSRAVLLDNLAEAGRPQDGVAEGDVEDMDPLDITEEIEEDRRPWNGNPETAPDEMRTADGEPIVL